MGAVDQEKEAINTIGTNGIPAYLQLLKKKDSKITSKWYAALDWLKNKFAIKIGHKTDREWNLYGYIGFRTLSTNAASAVPDLIRIYQMDISNSSRSTAIMSLGGIGPPAGDAIPFLLQGMGEKTQQLNIIEALGEIHSNPPLVVPVLINHLTDSDPLVRRYAAKALGEFGADAKPAFGAIAKLLNDEKAFVRYGARDSIRKIDPTAAAEIAK